MQRRAFLKMMGASAIAGLAFSPWVERLATLAAPGHLVYQGADLANWEVALGDGLYSAPGQMPVRRDDIATVHKGAYSELRANLQQRGIMAHNITFNRKCDPLALTYTHLCEYEFRLPFAPITNNWMTNGQTLEASFGIWDGGETRLNYMTALQWILNPWLNNFGAIRCWSGANGGSWITVGHLPPDTHWHKLTLVFDYQRQATTIGIDGQPYLSSFVSIPKPLYWGTETAARFAAEIISLYPDTKSTGPLHLAEFRNWRWIWIPN